MFGYGENLRGKYKTSEIIWGPMNTFLKEADFAGPRSKLLLYLHFHFDFLLL